MRRRIPAGAAFACALALAGAALAGTALAGTALPAAAEDGTSAPAARTIPVAPVDPAGMKGRIVYAIADWLEQRFGSGAKGLVLVLDAPIRAEERGGSVTVHLPGARLARRPKAKPEWTFGDLAIAVTPRSATEYEFESALPSVIEKRRERLTIGEGAIAGTWRSDLETTTGLDATAADLRLFKRKKSAPLLMSLGALAVADEMMQGADGLWDGRSSFSLSDLEAEGLSLGGLDIAGSFEDFDRDAILALRRDSGAFLGGEIGPEALGDGLALLVDGRWGRSDATLAVEDLTLTGADWYVGRDGAFTLGRLVWRVDFDGREELSDLATRISVAEPALSGKVARSLPPAFMPHAVTVDVALTRFPLRRIAGAFSGLAERGHMKKPDEEMLGEVLLAHLDAADTAFELRELHVAAPSYAFRAEGRFQAEPASLLGVVGRLDARIRGLRRLMVLAVREGNEGAVGVLLALQGLGRPVFEEGADEPVYAYELDLHRDGAVTINGLPLGVLLGSGLSPP